MLVKKAPNKSIVGTSGQGKMIITFDELVDLLGAPHYLYQHQPNEVPLKTRCEWDILIDNEPVSIYDWCQYEYEVRDITTWSIGGHSVKAVQKFMELKGAPMDTLKVIVDLSKF
jgi:hypothetical protein